MKRFLLCLSALVLTYLITTVIGPHTPIPVEPQVIEDMRAITKAELLYSLTKGRGWFTDLATLGESGFIDPGLASGEKNGYVFAARATKGRRMMFDVSAKAVAGGVLQTGEHSYYTNETLLYEVYKLDGGEAPEVTQEDRVPKRGMVVKDDQPE